MSTYRYINRDHTLVLRDDHVIAWDPKADTPLSAQPSAPSAQQQPPLPPAPRAVGLERDQEQYKPPEVTDEVQIWKDAGSPKPLETVTPRGIAPEKFGVGEGEEDRASWLAAAGPLLTEDRPDSYYMPDIVQREIDAAATTLDEIESDLATLRPTDLPGLRQQVQKLVRGLHVMIHAQRRPQFRPPPPTPLGPTGPIGPSGPQARG